MICYRASTAAARQLFKFKKPVELQPVLIARLNLDAMAPAPLIKLNLIKFFILNFLKYFAL
jgi:hypothetical protein